LAKHNKTYWICQTVGWLFYILVNLISYQATSNANIKDYILFSAMFPAGIFITHLFRYVIQRTNLLRANFVYQVITIIVSSLVEATLISLINVLLLKTLGFQNQYQLYLQSLVWNILNFSAVFFAWNIIYFGYHYFSNFKRAEIDNLRLEAAAKESELNSLKAQLNPHFMFNSMNSIRALVDEDPIKAKQAVTQLSNILRNSLLMNKNKEIAIAEEMSLVRDYLDLEKIRYEERLSFELSIDPKTEHLMVPPLIIQGQVENAIKHGISKLETGGKITVSSKLWDSTLLISITNTGQLNHERSATGLGFANSLQRLQLMYGKKAEINIRENTNTKIVETNIQIPLKNPGKN
jgi:two-component system LytT family sensor kinase